jgi:membrane dipeptidase
MNRLGMFVDISHVSAEAMRHVLRVSKAPVIASHSSAYAIKAHPRNVPDDVLKMIPANGGVIMVNFYTNFICDSERDTSGWSCDVQNLVDHIDHIVKVAGVESAGLGSDFDGVSTLPEQLKDVSFYPYITQELLNRHYSESDIKKILGGNLIRAFEKMERVAKGRS